MAAHLSNQDLLIIEVEEFQSFLSKVGGYWLPLLGGLKLFRDVLLVEVRSVSSRSQS